MPVLASVLLEASDNQLRLAATNLEIGVTCWIEAKVEDVARSRSRPGC
jgi:DNA polymerase-3 subunit beta